MQIAKIEKGSKTKFEDIEEKKTQVLQTQI